MTNIITMLNSLSKSETQTLEEKIIKQKALDAILDSEYCGHTIRFMVLYKSGKGFVKA